MVKTLEEQVLQAYKNIFATSDGRLVLQDLRGFCGIQAPSFIPGEPDTTACNEGHKMVFWHILELLEEQEENIEELSLTDNEGYE